MFLSSLLFLTSFSINTASELISQNFLVSKKENNSFKKREKRSTHRAVEINNQEIDFVSNDKIMKKEKEDLTTSAKLNSYIDAIKNAFAKTNGSFQVVEKVAKTSNDCQNANVYSHATHWILFNHTKNHGIRSDGHYERYSELSWPRISVINEENGEYERKNLPVFPCYIEIFNSVTMPEWFFSDSGSTLFRSWFTTKNEVGSFMFLRFDTGYHGHWYDMAFWYRTDHLASNEAITAVAKQLSDFSKFVLPEPKNENKQQNQQM